MTGNLNETEVNNVLASQVIGRLACSDGDQPYIMPVNYIFDGKYIYCQSNPGMKLIILRKNPKVCFEVDMVSDMNNWQSVIVYGRFEELKGDPAAVARESMMDRVFTLMTGSQVHAHQHEITSVVEDHGRARQIMYRIRITEKFGKYNRQWVREGG